MASSAWSRLRWGFGGHTFAQAVTFTVQLGGVPLFLYAWGAPLYGEWLVLTALPPWLVCSGLGLTNANINEVAMRSAEGDLHEALRAFQTTWVAVTTLSLFTASILLAGVVLAPLADWFGFSTLAVGDATLIVMLLLAHVLLGMQAEVAAAGLYASGSYGLHAFISASTRLIAFALVATLLVFGGSPVGAAVAMAAAECVGLLATIWVARRHSPWMHYGTSHASRATLRRLAAPSAGFVGLAAGNALLLQGPVLIIGTVVGPVAVALFATLRVAARTVMVVGNVALATLRPEMSLAYGEGDVHRLRLLHTRGIQLALWFGLVGIVIVVGLGPPLLAEWTVGRIAIDRHLLAWLAAGAAATLLWAGATAALHATNRHQEVALQYVVVAGVGLLVAALVAPRLGTTGVAATVGIAEGVAVASILRRTLAFVDQRLSVLAHAVKRPPTDFLSWLRRT